MLATANAYTTSFKALVLNASYEPLRIISWQKALLMWFQDKVEILEYHTAFARSVNDAFKLPSVLRLKTYIRPRKIDGVRFCRENVYIRDNYTCQYCAEKLPYKELTIDHVVPASHGGPKTWTNMVTACRKCNQTKANRTPEKAKMPLLRPAKAPAWLPIIEYDTIAGGAPSSWVDYLRFKTN
ncbi:MAG: HNH endonuclease [Bdellovibrionaceae bacterium]|nr:HNH endonuclease [Bdellovibrio sp.]